MSIENKLSTYINNEIDLWDFSGVIRVLQKGKIIFETNRGFACPFVFKIIINSVRCVDTNFPLF